MAEEEERRRELIQSIQRTVREVALEDIARRPQREREKAERFAELRSLADTYRQTQDLRDVLATALAADDDESSAAIFLEWHRRDPAAAFNELALLSGWSNSLEYEPSIMLALGVDEILAELSKPSRPYHFVGTLSSLAGTHWGEADDLASLIRCHASLPDDREDVLIDEFLGAWVPSDGAAAARILFTSPEGFRRLFLTTLRDGGTDAPRSSWTNEFATALLGGDLGACEDLRAELEAEVGRMGYRSHIPMSPPADEPNSVPQEKTPELAEHQIDKAVGELILRDRDYPALFGAGEMDLPAIEAELLEMMPGAERYPEELAKAMFEHLAASNPEAALKWAKDRMPEDDIRGRSTIILRDLSEPRLSRFGYLLSSLPTQYLGVDRRELRIGPGRSGKWLREQLAEWSTYAPGPAGEASAGIPPKSALYPDPESEEEMQNFRYEEDQ